ncbi:MAG: NAD(P)H-quinone oxidoreductase subunit 5 [Hyphomicrobiaceae bacterium]|jgi:NAD(P)H-quinone oxidoreductase subunit 5
MPPTSIEPSDLRALSGYTAPLVLLLAAAIAGRRSLPIASAWRIAQRAAVLALGAAMASLIVGMVWPVTSGLGTGWPTAFAVVLLLITFVGWVITHYSATYLAGEQGQHRFVRWLLATLAGASLVVVTGNLGMLVAAWLGTSLALQNLLTFYADRPQAQMAAHKKFLVSRLADACMITAAFLLLVSFGTLQIDELARQITAQAEVPTGAQVAVVLISLAALLKSAQLPFHGWLIQVMEAPTPVSALLHAGVVNIGGFVLIRLAALVASVPAAQVLLVLAGSLTAVLAAMVMSTRISIKVSLAWSTCAQMGFMVMQCGLGLFNMALLHLVAHSLYKAHAFLSAGGTVHQSTVRRMAPVIVPPSILARVAAAAVGASMALAASWLFGVHLLEQPALIAMSVVVSLSLAPLLAGRVDKPSMRWQLRSVTTSLIVAAIYFGLHRLLHSWLGTNELDLNPALRSLPLAAWIITCFVLLFAAQAAVAVWPAGAFAQGLYARFYGGLFLDEWFTRLTLRVWPNQRPASPTTSVVRSREAVSQ